MRVAIDNIDGPREFAAKTPVVAQLLRQIPGPDRPDYWVAALDRPFTIVIDNHDREITHLILAASWAGTASDVSGDRPAGKLRDVIAGHIAAAFGLGRKQSK